MTNVQAAIGAAQMELLETFVKRKNENYEQYKQQFKNCSSVRLMEFRNGTYSNKWFYALEILDKNESMRALVNRLSDEGIQTRTIWGLIHEQRPYQQNIAYKIEKAKYYSGQILNIPCSTSLKEDEIKLVSSIIIRTVEQMR